MPKSSLVLEVEEIAERITKRTLREYKQIATIGTWYKMLQDENRKLKRRVEELEIRVKKLNTYGSTPPTPAKKTNEAIATVPEQNRLTAAQIRKTRKDRGLSQSQFALLLGVSTFRYAKWESGRTKPPPEFDRKIRDIRAMKGSELRTRMQSAGIFQPNGKPSAKQPVPEKTAAAPVQEKLKEMRTALGLTQSQLATALGIKKSRYSNWECGYFNAPPEMIRKIEEMAAAKRKPEAPPKQTVPPEYIAPTPTELKAMRATLGLTQEQLATALGIKKGRYSNWEFGHNKAAFEIVQKIKAMIAEKQTPVPETPAKEREFSSMTADELRKIRARLGLTCKNLAALLGVKMSRYGNWEAGTCRIGVEFVEKLTALSGMSPAERMEKLRKIDVTPFLKPSHRRE